MDAILIPKNNSTELNDYQKRLIIAVAIMQTDGIPKRAERLKQLDFCTDSVKFEVLRESNKVNDKLYNELFKLYFAQKDNAKKPEPSSILQGPGWKEVEAKPRKLTDDEIRKMIDLYNRGTKIKELGVIFRRTTKQISSLIYSWKRSDKYKELFNVNKTKPAEKPQEQEKKFEEIIQSVDAGSRKEPEIKDEDAPEPFCAEGTGLISTDGSIKLDDEPILAALRKEMIDSGCVQCYGTVQITITPHKPTGMKVTRGCRE